MKASILAALIPLLSLAAANPVPPVPCGEGAPPAPPASSSAAAPASSAAAPAPAPSSSAPAETPPETGAPATLASVILEIAPKSKTCDDAKPEWKDECRTGEQAAPFIAESFTTYKIDNIHECAGLVALMILESGSFKYSNNHFPEPGRPGQGTRNMQSFEYNQKYGDSLFMKDGKNATYELVRGDEVKLLELLNQDAYSFGSAAWFLTSECTAEQRTAAQTGTIEGWHTWMEGCVGAPPDQARDDGYTAAQAAFKKLEGAPPA